MPTHPDEPDLTTSEVARLLKVSPSAVLTWADRGLLPHHRTPGGHRRFTREAVDALMARQARP